MNCKGVTLFLLLLQIYELGHFDLIDLLTP